MEDYKQHPQYQNYLKSLEPKEDLSYQKHPQYKNYLKSLEEKDRDTSRITKQWDKIDDYIPDAVENFTLGGVKSLSEYGASASKLLGSKKYQDKFSNVREFAEKKIEKNDGGIGGFIGEMVVDPLNLTPAGIFTKGTKGARIVKSVAGGAVVGAGTMAMKNYGNDTLAQDQKNLEMGIGAGFVAGINGIIAGVTKGRVTNAVDADLFVNKNSDEIADAIMRNPKGFGLSENEAKDVVLEAKVIYPKVPNEFKVEQAGFPQKPQEPNFRQVPQYPPMSQEQAISVLAKEANRKRIKRGEAPIYPEVQPEFKTESVYPQQPQQPYTPDFVSGDFNKNMPTQYSEAGNIEARYQKIASHPRLQELLEMRESVLAKESVSPSRNTDNGYFAHENNGNGYETTKIAPNTERNYNSDFQLTKQDIYKLYTGKADDDLLSKLETDLGTLDNHPDYAKSFNSENGIDYSKHQDPQYADKPKEMSDDDWATANEVFSKGADNLAVGTYAGVGEDENGNITFDAEKFVLGLGGYTAVKQALKNGKVQGELKKYAQQAIERVDFNPEVQKANGFNSIINKETKEVDFKALDDFAEETPSKINMPKFLLDFSQPIKTGIGDLTVDTSYLLNKIQERDGGHRNDVIHLIKPTLEKPAYILNHKGGFNFIKPFIENGKVKKFLSVISDKRGFIQEVTAHKLKNTDIKNIVKNSEIIEDFVGGATKLAPVPPRAEQLSSKASNSMETIIPQENINIKANAGHSMAGGFAGGADSAMNERDYNQDGEHDYKDILAGVAAGTVSINALKKVAPKLFDEGADTDGVKAGLFAGSKAKGFDAKAQAGKTFEGKYDTLERFEINDSKAVVSKDYDYMMDNNVKDMPLFDVLEHEEFFKNYPEAININVVFDKSKKGASFGTVSVNGDKKSTITLGGDIKSSDAKSVILHEVQHSIQHKEGFARGGSAQEFYNDAKKDIDLLKYELEFEPDEFIQDKMLAKLNKLEEKYNSGGKEEAFDMYQKLAGEIEARDVQARADYTPQQREEIAPYSSENIAQEDANVRFNNADDELVKNMSESAPKKPFKQKAKEAKAKGYEHIVKLVDKETKKEWGDATNTLKRLFTDTLGADYHKLREDATASTNGMSVKLERLHNVLNELSDTDRVSMHNYIVGEESSIPDALKPLAENIKKSIDDLSKQLVDLEVLPQEQYDEWAGHYIHRNYEKHFFKDIKGLMSKGFKLDDIHKRGKIEEINATDAKKLLVNPTFIASTKKLMKDGGKRLKQLPSGKYELRRDWTKEEREAMGEITDASISAPETLMRLKRMVDNANFMKNIEDIDNVILKDVDGFSAEEISAQGFAKVPNSPKFGVLAGKTIRKDVLDDLSARNDELFNTFHGSDGALGRIWKNYLSVWKKSKTVWNVPSHVNNFMSNTFLMHLAGMRADEVVTAVGKSGKMMVQGNKYEELLKKQMLGKATKSELSELAEMGEDLKYFIEAKEGGLLGRSQLNDILQGSQKQIRTSKLGKLDKFTEDAYHNGDAINRIAMYSHLRSKLDMSADEARKAVLTIMPDYSKPMPKGFRALRDSGVSPFISWSYYTMPAVVKMLGTKQGAKKATLAMGTLAGLEYALTGGDVKPTDNIPFMDTNKPEDFKGRRFGVSSKNGKVDTVKTDRWIPYVELLNPVNFLVSNVSGVTSNAVVNTLTANSAGGMINPYYGRPVTYKNKNTADKAYDYTKYLAKSYVPLPAQLYSGWDMIDSLARSKKKRRTNKVTEPRSTGQNILKQLGLNSLTYSKSGLKKEQRE